MDSGSEVAFLGCRPGVETADWLVWDCLAFDYTSTSGFMT